MTEHRSRHDAVAGQNEQDFAHIPFDGLLYLIQLNGASAALRRDGVLGTPSIVAERDGAVTRVRVRPVAGSTRDMIPIYGMLTVETDFPDRETPSSSAALSRVNVAPALGAAVLDDVWQASRVVSRFALYRGGDDVWPLYGPIIAAAAAFAPGAAAFAFDAHARDQGPDPVVWGEPGELGPSPWKEDEVHDAVRWLRSSGFPTEARPTKLMAQVPWVRPFDKNPPQPVKPCTLFAHVNAHHAYFGMGLMVRLEIPVEIESARFGEVLAWTLNDFDSRLVDGPPLLGAWYHRPDTNRVEHTSFLPRGLYRRGTCRNLVTWTAWRAQYAAEIVREHGGELQVPVVPSL